MQAINNFCDFYQSLEHQDVAKLGEVYTEDVTFIDPVSQHKGLSKVSEYFASLLQNTKCCDFDITHIHCDDNKYALVNWNMTFSHQKLKRGKLINVTGISHLYIQNDKISFQRDYYDMGEMIYEHVPILGAVVKFIKKRLNS